MSKVPPGELTCLTTTLTAAASVIHLRCSACDSTFVGLDQPPSNALRLNKVFLLSLEVECPPKAHMLPFIRFCPSCSLELSDLDILMSELINLKERIQNGKDLIRSKFTNMALTKYHKSPKNRQGGKFLLGTLANLVVKKWLETAQDDTNTEIVIGDGNDEIFYTGNKSKATQISSESSPVNVQLPPSIVQPKTVAENGKANAQKKVAENRMASVDKGITKNIKANIDKRVAGINSGKGASSGEGQPGHCSKQSHVKTTEGSSISPSQPVVSVPCNKYIQSTFYDESESGGQTDDFGGMSSGPVTPAPAVLMPPVGTIWKTSSPVGMGFTYQMCTVCFQYIAAGVDHLCGSKSRPTSMHQCTHCNAVYHSELVLKDHIRQHQ